MKQLLIIAVLAALPTLVNAQRESVKSGNKYNSAAARVPDAEKERVAAEKFNGQKPDRPQKPKPKSGKQPVQGSTENGGRVKNPTTKSGNR
ncbi:hypothetical protein [Spirosoma sp. 209]|uniref:hypothetical protein n=1 Tax=Spirosoma sp. 209 TaxID=1955701 RepID=UPI00098D0DD4|nr:hypothetical protein [Spirosoma sp. 209]